MAWGRKTRSAQGHTRSVESDELALAARMEVARRSGHPDEARQIAQEALQAAPDGHSARLALAMALMDLSDDRGAREQLGQYLGALMREAGMEEQVGSAELASEPRAEEALAQSLDGAGEHEMSSGEPASRRKLTGSSPSGFPLDSTSSFTTQTMAGLLDRQGDHKRADVIRERLDERVRQDEGAGEMASSTLEESDSRRVMETLNTWLENIERERA